MVKHIVIWNLLDSLSPEQKCQTAKTIKRELEGIAATIGGVVELRVMIDKLPTSNADIMLYSVFENEQALNHYLNHPEHKRVGAAYVRPNVEKRACIDCEW